MKTKTDSVDDEEFDSEPSSPVLSLSNPPSFTLKNADGHEDKPLFEEAICAPLVELPPPPDGGWGWVVCFASFMCNLILDGIAYTFGVLLEPLVHSFGSNRSTVAWVGSLLAGVYLMSGPVVGGLVNKFGCRPVCMLGSLVACTGLVLSTFSPNVAVLMLTHGVIGGLGLGLVYLPSVVMVGYYFENKRALATGISVCGSGVGTFLFAPLATYLLDQYGWQGANLIFAGLCLNCAVFGALMKPLELAVKPMPLEFDEEDEDEEEGAFKFGHRDSGRFTVQLPDGTHHKHHDAGAHSPPVSSLNADPGVNSSFHLNVDIGNASTSIQIPPLPTIVEQSITAASQQKNEHKSIADVFPNQDVTGAAAALAAEVATPTTAVEATTTTTTGTSSAAFQHHLAHRRHSGRTRTISETTPNSNNIMSKFHITPIKTKRLGPIPRNSSAPHFVDTSQHMTRNSSTPGFGRLARLHSHEDHSQHVVFGIDVGSHANLSNTQLYLAPGVTSMGSSRRNSRHHTRPVVRPLYRKDVFYSGSVMHLIEAHEVPPKMEGYRHSIISIPRRQSNAHRGSIVASHLSIPRSVRKASIIPGEAIMEPEGTTPITNVLKEMVNLSLLANPMFLLVGASNIFGMLGFYVPFVYLPNMAQLRGVSLEDANFLLSIIGISNTIGRVVSGWFSDFNWVDSLLVTNLALLFSGISVAVLPLCTSYGAFAVIALLFGFFVAAYVSLTSIILVDLLGLDNLTSAFGLLVLFRGVSSMVGSPVAGAIYDETQSYDVSFYMAGGLLVVSSLISFAAQFVRHVQRKNKMEFVS